MYILPSRHGLYDLRITYATLLTVYMTQVHLHSYGPLCHVAHSMRGKPDNVDCVGLYDPWTKHPFLIIQTRPPLARHSVGRFV
jgi:hypothetical protein